VQTVGGLAQRCSFQRSLCVCGLGWLLIIPRITPGHPQDTPRIPPGYPPGYPPPSLVQGLVSGLLLLIQAVVQSRMLDLFQGPWLWSRALSLVQDKWPWTTDRAPGIETASWTEQGPGSSEGEDQRQAPGPGLGVGILGYPGDISGGYPGII
jgi:hypothetical protein